MGKIIVSKCNGKTIVVDSKDVKENVKYWTGDEQVYAYNEEQERMELLFEKVTSQEDGLKYFMEIGDTDPGLYKTGTTKDVDGVMYFEVTEDITFDDIVCMIEEED